MTAAKQAVEIGVDVGGTFTDVVCRRPGLAPIIIKVPTTRDDPSVGVLSSLDRLKEEFHVATKDVVRFVHGTTVATNAVIERKGATVGLLTTEGFRDILEMGRQIRRAVYSIILEPETPTFLAPGARRKGVSERIAADGSILVPLDEGGVRRAAAELVEDGVTAIAICFLFSFLNPAHERRARDVVHEYFPDLDVSISSEVDPAFREYERTVATAFDAYIKPVVDGYLQRLSEHLEREGVSAPLQIMQSRGGICAASIARQRPVRLFLSGPAAGVVGARVVGQAAGIEDLITIDIGGTSCDISLIKSGRPMLRSEGIIDNFPVRVPMVDVNAIGAGGGSIAWLDEGGGLRVGPESAGADPGPACYGRGGEEATVTDASLVLGYINPDCFAGGNVQLQPALARAVIAEKVAEPLALTVEQAALGIHRVLNSQISEGIRLVSIRQGLDPREFALIALGGAGPLHATALAGDLSISTIVVPQHPGVLSAAGLLAAQLEHESSTAFPRMIEGLAMTDVRDTVAALDQRCAALMEMERIAAEDVDISYFADMCYVGQAYHLDVPLDLAEDDPLARLYEDFLDVHDRVFGHSTRSPARIVNLRTVHRAGGSEPAYHATAVPATGEARKRARSILLPETDAATDAAIYERALLAEADEIDGPAIIEQHDTTTLIEPGWRGRLDGCGNLIITRT